MAWQVDNVLIEAGSLIKLGAELTCSNISRQLLLEDLWYAFICSRRSAQFDMVIT